MSARLPTTEKIAVRIDADLKELVPTYLANVRDSIKKMRSAIAVDDMEHCRFSGHNLKGSGASYGFEFITEIGHKIEALAQRNNRASISYCLSQLEDYLPRLAIIYQHSR